MDKNEWCELWKEIKERSEKPLNNPDFVFFFIIAILIVGASGVWNEIINFITCKDGSNLSSLRNSIMSFFPVLSSSICLQVIWEDKFSKIKGLIIFLFSITGVGMYICANVRIADGFAIGCGLIATIISVFMWWIVNASNEGLMKPVNPISATGNEDPKEDLKGDIEGFKI